MKKSILSGLALVALFAVSCSPSKEKVKEKFLSQCEQEAMKNATDDAQKKLFKDYCACSAEKVMANLSLSEIEDLSKPEKQSEINKKIMPLIQPCLDELTSKSFEAIQSTTPEAAQPAAPTE